MLGFVIFVFTIVMGALLLAGGLQRIKGDRRPLTSPSSDPRFDRLESALALLESRLDDLQEQQRFLERLLAERPETRSLPRSPRERPADDSHGILFDPELAEEDREGGGPR
jgi:outer membrane murein-binding lipoprotein Lpp